MNDITNRNERYKLNGTNDITNRNEKYNYTLEGRIHISK